MREEFPAEVSHQHALKVAEYERVRGSRAMYDSDEDEEDVRKSEAQDCAPYCLHRYRLFYSPRPDVGNQYDVSANPPWVSFLKIPPTERGLARGVAADIPSLQRLVRDTMEYCTQDSDVESDWESDSEY
jgi:hypothetical protein